MFKHTLFVLFCLFEYICFNCLYEMLGLSTVSLRPTPKEQCLAVYSNEP